MLLFASCSSQPSSSLPATRKRLLCGSLRCATDKQMASVEEHLDDVEWFLRDRSDTMSSRVKHAHVHSARFGSKTTDFIKLVSGHNTKPVTALLPVTPKREALKVLEIQRTNSPSSSLLYMAASSAAAVWRTLALPVAAVMFREPTRSGSLLFGHAAGWRCFQPVPSERRHLFEVDGCPGGGC